MGWTSFWLIEAALSGPSKDLTLLASTPTSQCPSLLRTTAVGPIPHLFVPIRSGALVGSCRIGPNPQMNFSGLPDERNNSTSYRRCR